MATTPVPAFAAPPDFPVLSDRATGTYNSKAYAWAEAMQDTTGPNIHAIAVTAKANADDGALSAIAAAQSAAMALSDGAAQVALATTQANLATSAANAASATAGATQWVSGTAYTAGVCVWSPVNQQVYRRKTTGAGTTDPSADFANWTFVGAKPTIPRSARTSNTLIGAADNSTLIDITSGTFTQTFAAAAALGSGWFCYLRNSGTGDITLDPNGAETIDGLTSYVMYPGECRLVQCDGTGLRSVVVNGFYRAFTASGTFVKPPGYTKFDIMLWAGGGSGKNGAAGSWRVGGGGGGCAATGLSASAVNSNETVTIGAGGGSATASANGSDGGNSSFASCVAGGGKGGASNTTSPSGDGGYAFSAVVSSSTTYPSAQGGATSGSNVIYGGASAVPAGVGLSCTVYGGGGGMSITASNTLNGTNGLTVFGGAGGSTNAAGTAPAAGTVPGGGGGASTGGTPSGAGARGELRISGVI